MSQLSVVTSRWDITAKGKVSAAVASTVLGDSRHWMEPLESAISDIDEADIARHDRGSRAESQL